MRIADADILCYALLEDHVASPYTKPLIIKGLKNQIKLYVTPVTLLETYNTLFWYYKVRPRLNVARKIRSVAKGLVVLPVSERGFDIAVEENVPLGDALLVATALDNRIPIVVSNDNHVKKLCEKYGLIYENPIPPEIRQLIK